MFLAFKFKNYAKRCLILGVPPTISFDKCALYKWNYFSHVIPHNQTFAVYSPVVKGRKLQSIVVSLLLLAISLLECPDICALDWINYSSQELQLKKLGAYGTPTVSEKSTCHSRLLFQKGWVWQDVLFHFFVMNTYNDKDFFKIFLDFNWFKS